MAHPKGVPNRPAPPPAAAAPRPWEVWDAPGVAEQVDTAWRSAGEMAHRARLAKIVGTYMRPERTDTILEVGCGTGRMYTAMCGELGQPLRYLGVDNSRAMLAIARSRKGANAKDCFRYGDAYNLSHVQDESWDISVAFEVFGHMPSIADPIRELYRVARRWCLFTLWCVDSNVDGPILGSDHFEYPVSFVHQIIKNLTSVDGEVIYFMHSVSPVVLFSIPKGGERDASIQPVRLRSGSAPFLYRRRN